MIHDSENDSEMQERSGNVAEEEIELEGNSRKKKGKKKARKKRNSVEEAEGSKSSKSDEAEGLEEMPGPSGDTKVLSDSSVENADEGSGADVGEPNYSIPPLKSLEKWINREGWVDYAGLAEDATVLEENMKMIGEHKMDLLPVDNKSAVLAFWMNTYNIACIWGTVQCIRKKKGFQGQLGGLDKFTFFFSDKYLICGKKMTLYALENNIIRKFGEPRIHFCINCASFSCPRLRRDLFTAEKLEAQMEECTYAFINLHGGVKLGFGKNAMQHQTLQLSSIFKWYSADFRNVTLSDPEGVDAVHDACMQSAGRIPRWMIQDPTSFSSTLELLGSSALLNDVSAEEENKRVVEVGGVKTTLLFQPIPQNVLSWLNTLCATMLKGMGDKGMISSKRQFLGSDAVTWFVGGGVSGVKSRWEGVVLGMKLAEAGMIFHVGQSEPFLDSSKASYKLWFLDKSERRAEALLVCDESAHFAAADRREALLSKYNFPPMKEIAIHLGVEPSILSLKCIVDELKDGVVVKKRREGLRSVPNCFVAKHLVTFMVESSKFPFIHSRVDAVMFGAILQGEGWMNHVSSNTVFDDTASLFRFVDGNEGHLTNKSESTSEKETEKGKDKIEERKEEQGKEKKEEKRKGKEKAKHSEDDDDEDDEDSPGEVVIQKSDSEQQISAMVAAEGVNVEDVGWINEVKKKHSDKNDSSLVKFIRHYWRSPFPIADKPSIAYQNYCWRTNKQWNEANFDYTPLLSKGK